VTVYLIIDRLVGNVNECKDSNKKVTMYELREA